ncbi:unnamed protein product, partial [Prorocentrum cordatum]
MLECLAEGHVEATLLGMVDCGPPRALEAALLDLRACSRAWREQARPRLLRQSAEQLGCADADARLAALALLTAAADSAGGWEGGLPQAVGVAATAVACRVRGMLRDDDPDVRRAALRCVLRVCAPWGDEAPAAAARCLGDPHWPVRWAAVGAVAHVGASAPDGGAKAAGLLAARLRDREWPVRRA